MRPALMGIMQSQHGLFLRRQALACGYTRREFEAMARPPSGPWQRVRYGVYVARASWQALDKQQKLRLIDRAATLVCAADVVLSHSSAARVLDLPTYDVNDDLVHVTRTGNSHTGKVEAGIKHHRAALSAADVTTVEGMRCTSPLRTAVDMAREFGLRSGLVAADAALGPDNIKTPLIAMADALTCEAGAPTVRAMVALADGRAQTPIETLSRLLLVGMGITGFELQFKVRLPDGHYALADIYVPALGHIFECDGRLKYRDQYDDRGRPVSAEEVLWAEKRREDQLRGLGYGVSRIVWSDVLESNFLRASTRLWQEIRDQAGPRREAGLPRPEAVIRAVAGR